MTPQPAFIGDAAPTFHSQSLSDPANFPNKPLFSLSGTTIAITGGGRGLGIFWAGAVLEAGGHVACIDVLDQPEHDKWAALHKAASKGGLHLSYHQCDVTQEEKLSKTMDSIAATAESLGAPFYGVIAGAGVQQKMLAIDYPKADFERIFNINVTGAFLTAKLAARILMKRGVKGSIVMIASISGSIANRGLTCTAYNSSKAAVQQMARSMAQEWGRYGIRVNTISPGYIRTAMTDMLLANEPELEKLWMAGALLGRLGTPEDLKSPAIFLLSRGSSFITGTDLRVDGGHCAAV